LSLIGFIPTEKGYVHVQPNIVIYYIKIVFAVIPIILSIVSFVFKNRYPIKEEYNILIKKGIEVQKMNFNIIKKTK
jgi:Na+/melibiose symporter-like transporter